MKYLIGAIILAAFYTTVTEDQTKLFDCKAPVVLGWGPGGSGKTHCAVAKAVAVCAKYPHSRVYVIRRTRVDLKGSIWLKLEELLAKTTGIIKSYNKTDLIYRFTNGSEIWGMGLDSQTDVTKIASAECSMAIVEEAHEIPEDYYDDKISRAVRLPNAGFYQLMLLCNPQAPSHWINQKFLMRKEHENIYLKTIPRSTGILPASWHDWLDGLQGVFGKRYRDGEWVALEGVVYPFDPQKHIIKPFAIPEGARIIKAVDFGYDHPFVCQWWYVSSDDIWYLYRQIYMSRRRVADHAKEIIKFIRQDKDRDLSIICDHDAENMATLREAGLDTIPAKKQRLAGQQSVMELFEQNRIFHFENNLVEVDMVRKMKKLPTCTEDEYSLYGWATKGKEDMVKTMDDGMDAERYAVHTTIEKHAPTVRVL